MNRGRRGRLMAAAVRAARAGEPTPRLCGALALLQLTAAGVVALACEHRALHDYGHAHFLPDGTRVTWGSA